MYLILRVATGVCNICTYTYNVLLCKCAPLDVLCDLLPVFEHVDQLVCLNIKDPQVVGLAMLPATTRLQHTVCSSATCDCIIVYIYHGQFRHLHLQLLFLGSIHLESA